MFLTMFCCVVLLLDKPPPPVAQFDLRSIKRSDEKDHRIQSARGADERSQAMDDRRRINSARMDSDRGSMRSRMTTSSTSTVRLVNSNVTYHTPQVDSHSASGSESIHDLDMNNIQVGMRRAGSAPLSTINSEAYSMEDEKSIQWNLMLLLSFPLMWFLLPPRMRKMKREGTMIPESFY